MASSIWSKDYSFLLRIRYDVSKKDSYIFSYITLRLYVSQELSHYSFKYGYVTHTNQRGLYKLDLVNLRYTRSVDLTPYNCVPEQVQFSALCKYDTMF